MAEPASPSFRPPPLPYPKVFPVGRAHVNSALKVTLSDEGCQSGAAATFHIFATWGVHEDTSMCSP